jgi:tetratricopeptide (TPR) repeat protein
MSTKIISKKNLFIYICLFSAFSTFVFSQIPKVKQPAAVQTTVESKISDAQILLKQGKTNEAIQLLQTTLQTNPKDKRLLYWIGKIYYSSGNYQKAIDNLTPVVGQFTVNSDEDLQSVQMLGLSHYVLGHLSEAIPYFEKMLIRQPENSEIAYALGVSYIQTRRPEKSRAVFAKLFGVQTNSEALRLDPKLPNVNFILGEMAIYKAEIDKGIAYLKREIELNPANSMAYYRLGEGLSRQLKWDEAIPPLQKSVWLNPFFSGPYIVLGKVYFKKGDLENAENLLRRSTQIDPNNFGAHYLLAQVLQQSGKTQEASNEFALAEKLRGANEQNPN